MTPTVLKDPGVGESLSITRLVEQNVLSPLIAAYMWFIVERKALFFIAGPTGSGKTTLLNALLCLMGPTEALKPDLGMKSDYLIVGEIRTARDLDTFLDVMRAGHSGLATIHASNPDYLLMRLRAMGIDPKDEEKLWGCAVTLPALRQGTSLKRRVVVVADFMFNGAGMVESAEVVKWIPSKDSYEPTEPEELFERSPKLRAYSKHAGVAKEKIIGELAIRKTIIETLVKDGIFDCEQVAKTIASIKKVERN